MISQALRFGLPHLLFVCLDAETLDAAQALVRQRAGFAALLLKPHAAENKKSTVERAKFGTAVALSRLRVNFVFLEMDVWLVRPVRDAILFHFKSSEAARAEIGLRLLRGQLTKPPQEVFSGNVDLLVAVHQGWA